jgi:uroporphyrinogen decarboxylase
MEQTLVDLMTGDEGLLAFIDRRQDVQREVALRTIEAAKGRVDLLWMGEDLGCQYSPLVSIEMYRECLRPRHQRIVDLGRAFGIPVMVHSCGSSSWVYDDFIEMGVSVVDTLQPEAKDMSPDHLKSRYGEKLAFHGGISTAGPLASGNVDDVKRNVRGTLEIMMPGGGYAMAPTHQIQDNSPTENVIAMYEAALEYGRY